MEFVFLGTGPAWGLPELFCGCEICRCMASKGQKRRRAAFIFKGKEYLLLDCGPDIKEQLEAIQIEKQPRAILISHEHNDHFMGLDDLFPFKRTRPRGDFHPIELYLTETTYQEVKRRFGYLEDFEVVKPKIVQPLRWYDLGEFAFMPFKTYHGSSAKGSVGFLLESVAPSSKSVRLLYTSDFMELEGFHGELRHPDYLVIQSFWLNEPKENRPHHMSFQRAMEFIRLFEPKKAVFLVHMGDGDAVPMDPRNNILKKYVPKDPLRPPRSSAPYPIPKCQEEWQEIVDTICHDHKLPWNIYVAQDFQSVSLC